MRHDKNYKSEEDVEQAYRVAVQGGVSGAARWGLFSAIAGTLAHIYWPPFRTRLTTQFKVFLQFAFMTMGGMIEADRRMVEYELVVRHRRRMERARIARNEYDREVLEAAEAAAEVDEKVLEDEIRAIELRVAKSSRRRTDT